jgi:ABC-type uncharacterized transport system ATPase subunit
MAGNRDGGCREAAILDEPTGGMSLAERRTNGELLRRSSARTVMSRNPKLLLLDEPTASGSG